MGLLKKQEKSNQQLKSSDYIPRAGSAVGTTFNQAKNRLAAVDNLTGWKKKAAKIAICLLIVLVILSMLYALVPGVKRGVASTANGISIIMNGPCNGDKQLINRYNETVKKQGIAFLDDISVQVKDKKGYADDATCVYIATIAGYAQISTKGIGEAQMQYERLMLLEKESKQPSVQINDSLDTKEIFLLLEKLVKEGKQNYDGQG